MVRCDFTIQLTGTAPAGGYLVNYGSSDALGPFPFHQLISTFQATVNNNTVNLNTQDVLNCIIRSNDNRELQAFNGLTPVMYDTYHSYADAVLANNNPNGSYVVQSDYDIAPRGAYFIDPVMTGNTIGPGAKTVNIKVSVVEPLLISPFIFADPKSNNGGMAGIQNLTFTANLASNAHRAFRSANSYITNAVVTDIDKAELIFNFLTPHVGSTMPSRQICPYYELPRYISKVGVPIPNGATVRIESQSLQLNVIPDKLFIFVRKTLSSQKVQDADSFLPIKGISINFNNQSGILSSATPYDLYRFSREAGSNQNFNEFQGRALRNNPGGGAPIQIATTGSMLMLNMGQHVQLTEGWYAPGSLGNFVLQFSLDVANYTGTNYAPGTANELELVLVTLNSGAFATERGASSVYLGLLNKNIVIDLSNKNEAYTASDIKRMVGGGWLDSLKSIGKAIAPIAKVAAPVLFGDKGKVAADVIGALGFGQSGGGSSGGRKLASRLM